MMEIYPAIFCIIHSIGPLEKFFLHNTLIKMLLKFISTVLFSLYINIEKISLPKWKGNRIVHRELLVDSIFIPHFMGNDCLVVMG